MPMGVEISLKLMLPGEQSEVMCKPSHGYKTCVDAAPANVPTDETLYFSIELISFEKEGHPQAMDADEMILWGQRQKAAANALYNWATDYAIKKYGKVCCSLDSSLELRSTLNRAVLRPKGMNAR
jgi:hypothetical protein